MAYNFLTATDRSVSSPLVMRLQG